MTESLNDHEALKGQRGKIKDSLFEVSAALASMETKQAALTKALELVDRKIEAAAKARQLMDYQDD
jgi:hypothetical protein